MAQLVQQFVCQRCLQHLAHVLIVSVPMQVIGLALMCCTAGFFFAWSAGKCIPKNPDWGEEYGMRFQ
jgi:hypothetical protein